jgi:hypothetical protein
MKRPIANCTSVILLDWSIIIDIEAANIRTFDSRPGYSNSNALYNATNKHGADTAQFICHHTNQWADSNRADRNHRYIQPCQASVEVEVSYGISELTERTVGHG